MMTLYSDHIKALKNLKRATKEHHYLPESCESCGDNTLDDHAVSVWSLNEAGFFPMVICACCEQQYLTKEEV